MMTRGMEGRNRRVGRDFLAALCMCVVVVLCVCGFGFEFFFLTRPEVSLFRLSFCFVEGGRELVVGLGVAYLPGEEEQLADASRKWSRVGKERATVKELED